MELKVLSIKELREAIETNSLWDSYFIPIVKHRAISQINNPLAKDDDKVLFMAYDNNELVGYIGVLPGEIYIGGKSHRVGWLTAWWAKPSKTKPGYGSMVLSEAFKHWNDDLCASSPSKLGKKAFSNSRKFIDLQIIKGKILFIGFDFYELLSQKYSILTRISLIIKFFDFIGNIFCNSLLFIWKKLNPINNKVKIEYLHQIDSETAQFIESNRNQNDFSKISPQELDWMMKYPWIIDNPLNDINKSRCFFASSQRKFNYLFVKILNKDLKIIGFVVLKISNNYLSIPFIFAEPTNYKIIAKTIVHHAIKLNIKKLGIFKPELTDIFSKIKLLYFIKLKKDRLFIISKKYEKENFENLIFQDGDGDLAFF
jgi:hypothetical protein